MCLASLKMLPLLEAVKSKRTMQAKHKYIRGTGIRKLRSYK